MTVYSVFITPYAHVYLAYRALSGIEHEEKRALSVPGPHVQRRSCGQATLQTSSPDWVSTVNKAAMSDHKPAVQKNTVCNYPFDPLL